MTNALDLGISLSRNGLAAEFRMIVSCTEKFFIKDLHVLFFNDLIKNFDSKIHLATQSLPQLYLKAILKNKTSHGDCVLRLQNVLL